MADPNRWNNDPDADRETAWHGEDRYPPEDRGNRARPEPGERRFGVGDYEPSRSWGDDERRFSDQNRWRPYDPGMTSAAGRDQGGVRWHGEAGPSPRDASRTEDRGEDRSFIDRARDEVATWFGDRDAEARRRADGEHRGRGPRGYRRSDERISDDIHDRLTDDSWLDASDIEVQVRGGEVTLAGRVRTRDDRRRAEDIAEGVSGVGHVQNNLRADEPRAAGGYQADPSSYRF